MSVAARPSAGTVERAAHGGPGRLRRAATSEVGRAQGRLRFPLARRAALASVATALMLLVIKGAAAWRTGSVAMAASLADTGLDLLSSIVNLYCVRLAAEPADHRHRFGYGKAEALAALFQVALVSLSAVMIATRAVSALGSNLPVREPGVGIGVSIAAIAATTILVLYQRSVVRRTGSLAIAVDSVHYQSDIMLGVAVIAALLLERNWHVRAADPVFGICIAAWLAWGAFRASSRAVGMLMDREWTDERRAAFLDVAARQKGLLGIHDFRTRQSGSRDFAQFHMEVDPLMTVAAAHLVVEGVEAALRDAFPEVEVLIHLDPEGHVDSDSELAEADVTPHWFAKRI